METFYHGFVVIISLSLVLPSHCCYNLLTENRFLVGGTLGDPRLISKSYKATTRLSSTQDYVAAVFCPTGCFILFRTTSILNRWAAKSARL